MNQNLNRREFLKVLGLTIAASTMYSEMPPRLFPNSKNDTQNILIIVFDALSAGHMSIYGYPRETTPNISKFAEKANVYHNHYSPANFTSPGTASLLTGVYPWTHRGFNLSGSVVEEFVDQNLFSLLHGDMFTTSYTHNSWANILLSQFSKHIDLFNPINLHGLAGKIYSQQFFPSDYPAAFWSETILRGKEQLIPASLIFSKLEKELLKSKLVELKPDYEEKYPLVVPDNLYGMYFTLEETIDWIQSQVVSLPQNYLAYYHLFPPHDPYRPRSEFLNQFDDGLKFIEKPVHYSIPDDSEVDPIIARQLYDEFISNVDSEFGRLINFMQNNGVLEDTIVILTSDHGELFERGIVGHGTPALYQNILHIPLLISLPNQKVRKDFYSKTSSVDILPTMLQLTGNRIPEIIDGIVLPGINSSSDDDERILYAVDTISTPKHSPITQGTFTILKDHYKLIQNRHTKDDLSNELYDLENDPEEMENLDADKRQISKELESELSEQLGRVNQKNQNQ